MIKLLDRKSEVVVTVAGTILQFRPLMYEERMSLTIASVSTFQTEFAEIPEVSIKDKDGNDILVNPYRTLMRNELFGKAIDKIMVSTFVKFRDDHDLTVAFGEELQPMLDSMQERSEREYLRDQFLTEQGIDFEKLLMTAGNSASLSDKSPQNQEADKDPNDKNGDSSTATE